MPNLPPCVAEGNQLVEVDSGFHWLISPGIDPSTVLTQDQIDCHFEAMEQVNASYEAQVASDGKFVQWRSDPVWVDDSSGSPKDWYKAESLSDVGIDCDVDNWNAAYEATPHFKYFGSYGKGLKTYYCIGNSEPAPPVDPPEDGPENCGSWDVLISRPVQVPLNTPTWIEFQITGTFPPAVTSDFEITALFDGSEDLVESGGPSGILEVDEVGRRVRVVLTDGEYHHLDIFVAQPDCSSPSKFDTEMLRASTEATAECLEILSDESIRVCSDGSYKAVVTICGQDHDSNTLVISGSGSVLPKLPVFILHPQTQDVDVGSDVTLTGIAKYATSFQWQIKNDVGWIDVDGETSPNISFTGISLSQSGTFRLIATNSAGSVASAPATLTVSEVSDCPVYIVLRCDTERTCHGVMLQKVGPGDDDVDFVLDWFSTTASCCNPVVVRCPTDGSLWELFIVNVGGGSSPDSYVIDWRIAASPYEDQVLLFYSTQNRCLGLKMTKVGPGSAKEDYVLGWESV